MKFRRQRVAIMLLLTGVLPLMAKDDTPTNGETYFENDEAPSLEQNAAEKMHDNDILTSIPNLQSLQNIGIEESIALEEFVDILEHNTRIRSLEQEFNYRIRGRSSSIWHSSNLTCPSSNEPFSLEKNSVEEEDLDRSEGDFTNNMATPSNNATTATTAAVDGDSTNNQMEEKSEADTDIIKEEDDEDDVVAKRLIVDYASKSAGALILESSESMKGASNLLVGDKDRYAITPCSTGKKFVVIGLSEDILVKQIKISNYERYASLVEEFQVFGSQTINNNQPSWIDLGTFTAKNRGNTEQSFDLKEPSWARYLKFRFMTHYGSEHYCTLSQVKVHGSTMLQGFHEQWNEGEEENDSLEGKGTEEQESKSKEDEEIVDQRQTEGENVVTENEHITKQGNVGTKVDDIISTNTIEGTADQHWGESSKEKNTNTNDVLIEDVQHTIVSDDGMKEEKLKTALLLPSFDIDSSSIPKALASPRFLRPATHKSYNAAFTKIDFLDTIGAINPNTCRYDFNNPIKNVDTEECNIGNNNNDQDYSTTTVTDAMQTLSLTIQSTIGMTIDLQQTIQTMIGNALPRVKSYIGENIPHQVHDDDSKNQPESDDNKRSKKVEEESNEKKNEELLKVQAEIYIPSSPTTIVDGRILDIQLSAGLSEVLSRYPSSKCLESLDFMEFKRRSIAKASSNGSPTAGKVLAPIFKTLTDEIKVLQISQNVHDQFSRALIVCYQSIMIEMANEQKVIHSKQEERLSKLESEMMRMMEEKDDSISQSVLFWKFWDISSSFLMNPYDYSMNFFEKQAYRVGQLEFFSPYSFEHYYGIMIGGIKSAWVNIGKQLKIIIATIIIIILMRWLMQKPKSSSTRINSQPSSNLKEKNEVSSSPSSHTTATGVGIPLLADDTNKITGQKKKKEEVLKTTLKGGGRSLLKAIGKGGQFQRKMIRY